MLALYVDILSPGLSSFRKALQDEIGTGQPIEVLLSYNAYTQHVPGILRPLDLVDGEVFNQSYRKAYEWQLALPSTQLENGRSLADHMTYDGDKIAYGGWVWRPTLAMHARIGVLEIIFAALEASPDSPVVIFGKSRELSWIRDFAERVVKQKGRELIDETSLLSPQSAELYIDHLACITADIEAGRSNIRKQSEDLRRKRLQIIVKRENTYRERIKRLDGSIAAIRRVIKNMSSEGFNAETTEAMRSRLRMLDTEYAESNTASVATLRELELTASAQAERAEAYSVLRKDVARLRQIKRKQALRTATIKRTIQIRNRLRSLADRIENTEKYNKNTIVGQAFLETYRKLNLDDVEIDDAILQKVLDKHLNTLRDFEQDNANLLRDLDLQDAVGWTSEWLPQVEDALNRTWLEHSAPDIFERLKHLRSELREWLDLYNSDDASASVPHARATRSNAHLLMREFRLYEKQHEAQTRMAERRKNAFNALEEALKVFRKRLPNNSLPERVDTETRRLKDRVASGQVTEQERAGIPARMFALAHMVKLTTALDAQSMLLKNQMKKKGGKVSEAEAILVAKTKTFDGDLQSIEAIKLESQRLTEAVTTAKALIQALAKDDGQ